MKRPTLKQRVIEVHLANPSWNAPTIGRKLGVASRSVRNIAQQCGLPIPWAWRQSPYRTDKVTVVLGTKARRALAADAAARNISMSKMARTLIEAGLRVRSGMAIAEMGEPAGS